MDTPSRNKDGQTRTLVRKRSCAGVGYSVVNLNDVSHVFAVAVPRKGDTLDAQAADALKTIRRVMDDESARGSIVNQAVFYSDERQLERLKQIIREFYGPELPATTYVPQHPCDGKLLSIEALGVGREFGAPGEGQVDIERRGEHVVVTRHNGIAWVHFGQIVPRIDSPKVYDRAIDCFEQMRDLLAEYGVGIEQIIRTWLYLGDIVGPEGPTQRYKELNRARTDFFRDYTFGKGLTPPEFEGMVYPASTGIGTDNHDVIMSGIALATDRDDITGVPLENPRQTAAFDYAAIYSPESPKFVRAMALSCGRYATLLVSGTASITASETQHPGDPVAQTHETLDNIAALISEENLANHGMPGRGTTLDGLAFARVYVKRQEDYPAIRAVCRERLGELPTVFAVADVCRDDLLVEIEGIGFAANRQLEQH